MAGKTDSQFLFEVQLNWQAGTKGILSAADANGTIEVATPPKFGGEGRPWTPEHLFLSSVSSCYMTTFLAFAKKLRLELSGFECDSIGQIELIHRKYQFADINLYPKIYVPSEDLKGKAAQAVDKTHQHCLIINSVNANIYYHSQVLVRPYPEPASEKSDTYFQVRKR